MNTQREIKFRQLFEYGQDADNITGKKWIVTSLGGNGIFQGGGFVCWSRAVSPMVQFTGLHDKNGKEIYEGDIVSVPSTNAWGGHVDYDMEDGRCVISFEHGRFGIMRAIFMPLTDWMLQSEGQYIPNYGNATVYGECVLTVIGNVYEHPELLKA